MPLSGIGRMNVIQSEKIACNLLKLEQQLLAYQKLHEDELSELWQVLNECKQAITTLNEKQPNKDLLKREESDKTLSPKPGM